MRVFPPHLSVCVFYITDTVWGGVGAPRPSAASRFWRAAGPQGSLFVYPWSFWWGRPLKRRQTRRTLIGPDNLWRGPWLAVTARVLQLILWPRQCGRVGGLGSAHQINKRLLNHLKTNKKRQLFNSVWIQNTKEIAAKVLLTFMGFFDRLKILQLKVVL